MSEAVVPKRAKFLLCDDVRAEFSGKLILIGLYPDDKILIQPYPAQLIPPAGAVAFLNQFAIACLLFDGYGVFPINATVADPSGKIINNVSLGNSDFKAGMAATIVLQLAPFAVTQFGAFTCKVNIGTTTFPFAFDVERAPVVLPATSPPSAPVANKTRRSAKRVSKRA